MKQFNPSLRSKLIGLVLAVVLLLGVGTVFSLNQFENDYKHRIKTQMVIAAVKLGKAITAQLYERYGDAQAFAINRSVTSLNKELMQGDLDQYIKLYGIYDLILVIDKNGKLVAANSVDINGKPVSEEKLKALNFSKMPWFENALKGHFTEDKENGYAGTYVDGFLLNTVVAEAYGEAKYGSIFSTPIKDSKGEVIGVLANHAGSRWYESEMGEYHKQMVDEELVQSEIMLFNGEGKVMSHSAVDPTTKKTAFETDPKLILNKGFDQFDEGLGNFVKQDSSGFNEFADQVNGTLNLIAYHNVKNSKSINSLGWTVLVEDPAVDAYQKTQNAKMQSYFILFIMSFVGVLLATWAGIIISKSVARVTATLAVNSDEVSDASHKIASSSTELSETATEQAAALQETVAAVDEISAMVDRNSESAQKSKDVSQLSRVAANKGRDTVANMIVAIQEIDRSNDEISQQMDESNKQLQEITKLINDISNKTTVINEIVFQTKLLSFNASVEAARAGEYGKGFAVVAEEVGNLAQMSGNAAKEISELLEQSVQKVNNIVSETKSRVDRLMLTSKDKVNHGSRTAQECNNSLEEILTQVQTVDSLVSEIAVASQEQSTGIREVSRAIGQMEQATQQNSAVANATSVAGEQIRAQSDVLNSLVQDLSFIVTGQSHTKNAEPIKVKKNITSGKQPKTKLLAKFEPKREISKPAAKDQEKDAPKNMGRLLNFVTGKKSKNVEANETTDKSVASPAPIEMKKSDPVPAKPSAKSAHSESTEKLAMASGADYVPSGDDPGFSE